MTVPFFTATREYQNRKNEFDLAIKHVLERGDFILGNDVKEFENELASYANANFALGVANGSDALVLACDALGYKNAEVITPVLTFFASTSCIVRVGGIPKFCDVDETDFCIDANMAGNLVNKKTRGILPVHLFSEMANMTAVKKIAAEYALSIVEDAAEAFGMKQTFNGKKMSAGTIGDAGVYSFFPTKTLGGYGDGGAILTNDEKIFEKVKALRVHGAMKKYHHDFVGYNSRLDTLQAAILRVKLQKINEAILKRKKIADLYFEELKDVAEIILPKTKPYNDAVFYVFQIRAKNRDALADFLHENEIGTAIYYPVPLHLQKCFSYLGYKKGDFPVAEKLCGEVLALPIFPELTDGEVHFVCEKIKEFYKK